MNELFAVFQGHVGFFLLMLVRMSGLFVTAPFFGSRNVSGRIRMSLAFMCALLLFPMVFRHELAIPDTLFPFPFMVIKELLVGLVMGFTAYLFFTAVQMAGQLLDMQIGFGMVSVFDPLSGQQVPLLGNFKYILAMLVFLSTNSHHFLFSGFINSYQYIPIKKEDFKPQSAEVFADMVGGLFVIAMKISIPVLSALLLSDIALGILARTMPQMNIFVVGIPVKIFIGLFVLTLVIPFYILFLEVAFNGMYQEMYKILLTLR